MKKLLLLLLLVGGSSFGQGWPAPAPPELAQGTPLFFDDFEYVVERNDPNKAAIFYARDYTFMKDTAMAPDRHANGYIYTSDTVLGYEGPMPGSGDRVLVLETLPSTLGFYTPEFTPGAMQTDLFLQLGDPLGSTDYIPADVWFQFWVYHTAGLTGSMERQNKFLYVCRSFYPCTLDENGESQYEWMFLDGTTSSNPHWDELGVDGTMINRSYFTARAPRAIWAEEPYAMTHMGSNEQLLPLEGLQWYLVKIHFDTSNPYGVFEMWITPRGGEEVKVAEWLGGRTPGFMWVVINNEGHSVLRLRTTNGGKYPWQYYPLSYDITYYIDDFTMAAHEADLPRY